MISQREIGTTYSLAERPALANCDLITFLNTESRRDVGGEVLVSLLVSGVLRDELEVLASDDNGSVHLGGNDGAGQDTATNRDETGEGALLVYVDSRISFELVTPIFTRNLLPKPPSPHESGKLPRQFR